MYPLSAIQKRVLKAPIMFLVFTQQALYGALSTAWEVNPRTRAHNAAEERAFSHPNSMSAYAHHVRDKELRQAQAEVLYQMEKAEKNAAKMTSSIPIAGSPAAVARLLVERERDQLARELAEGRAKMSLHALTFDGMIDKARDDFQQRSTEAKQKEQAILSDSASSRSKRDRASAYADRVQHKAPAKFIQSLRQQNADLYHAILGDPTKSKKDKEKAHTVYVRQDRAIDSMLGLESSGDGSSHVHPNERAGGHIASRL